MNSSFNYTLFGSSSCETSTSLTHCSRTTEWILARKNIESEASQIHDLDSVSATPRTTIFIKIFARKTHTRKYIECNIPVETLQWATLSAPQRRRSYDDSSLLNKWRTNNISVCVLGESFIFEWMRQKLIREFACNWNAHDLNELSSDQGTIFFFQRWGRYNPRIREVQHSVYNFGPILQPWWVRKFKINRWNQIQSCNQE